MYRRRQRAVSAGRTFTQIVACVSSNFMYTTELSFSSLRRFKTLLRTTMTQQRLNAVAVCHAHGCLASSVG